MKRGMSGKTRRGSPPLPRQRKALRVVQLTLLAIGVTLAALAYAAIGQHQHPLTTAATVDQTSGSGRGEVIVLGAGALGFAALALAMGLRVVRGPEPDAADFD
jgi:hypothetical protein